MACSFVCSKEKRTTHHGNAHPYHPPLQALGRQRYVWGLLSAESYRIIVSGNFAAFARRWKGDGENFWLGDILTEAQKCIVVGRCIDGLEHLLGGEPKDIAAFEVEVAEYDTWHIPLGLCLKMVSEYACSPARCKLVPVTKATLPIEDELNYALGRHAFFRSGF